MNPAALLHDSTFRLSGLGRSTVCNPNLMTTKERIDEVCAILARGIVRLRLRDAQVSAETGENGLHFSPDRSGGANPLSRSST